MNMNNQEATHFIESETISDINQTNANNKCVRELQNTETGTSR